MSQVTHILLKDLRRLRWLLVVWGVILIAQIALSAIGAATAGVTFPLAIVLRELAVMLPVLQTLMLALLVARLVHDEPLVGLNAFWLTRPYSRSALLAAKLLFVAAVLVLMPLIADLVTMSLFHAGPRAQLSAAPAFASAHLTWALGLSVVAALTPSLAAFVLTLIATIVGLMTTLVVIASIAFAVGAGQTSSYDSGPILGDPTPGIISLIVFVAVALGVVVYQYRRRRRGIAVALAVAGVVASVIIPGYWPWPFLRPLDPDPGSWARNTQATQVSIDRDLYLDTSDDPFETGERPHRRVSARVQLTGKPAAFEVQGVRVDATLTLPDGATIRSRQMAAVVDERTRGLTLTTADTPARAALGGIRVLNEVETRSAEFPVLLSLTEQQYARHKGQAGRFDATLGFLMYRTRVRATLPLRDGAVLDHGVSRIEVVRATPVEGGYRVVVRHWRVLPLTSSPSFQRFEFFLRSRSHGSAVRLGEEMSWSGSFAGSSHGSRVLGAALAGFSFSGGSPTGFAVQTEALEFPWRLRGGGYVALARLEPEWFRDAELVVLETDYAGTVTRSVTIADFRIPEQ